MDMSVIGETVLTFVLLVIAVHMFCHSYPPREGLAERALAIFALFGVIIVIASYVGYTALPVLMTDLFLETQILTFVGVLFLFVAAVKFCFNVSLWTALFCCTAGYTTQNLAMGTHGLIMVLAYWNGFDMEMGTSGIVCVNPIATTSSILLSALVVYSVVYQYYVRQIKREGLEQVENKQMLFITLAAAIFEIAFDMVNKGITTYDIPQHFLIILKLTHGATCIMVLYMQYELLFNSRLQLNAAINDQMEHEARRQYAFTKESIDAINARCHDIRHQIRELGQSGSTINEEALGQLAQEISVYDSSVHTGNDALDTLLTAKSLRCRRENISLACICDGEILNFVSNADLYALFGNALDNAIDATSKIADPTARSISVIVKQHGQMAMIHVENRFEGSVKFGRDGLPISKGDTAELHGYGSRSMKLMVERHEGTISWSTQSDIFYLDALIPIPVD